MPAPQLVIFDLAGTIIRDRGEVGAAFAAALGHAGIAFEPAELTQWRGASKREVLAQLVSRQSLPPAIAAQAYADFSASLKGRFSATRDLAFSGASATFAQLKAAGVRLALNSGFDRDIVDLVLTSVPWPSDTFDAVARP